MKVKQIAKIAWKFVDENAPTILMVAAELLLVCTTVSAIKDAPVAKEKIHEAKVKKLADKNDRDPLEVIEHFNENDILETKLTVWEYTQVLVPVYWRTAVCFVGCGTCIFFSNRVLNKRYLAVLGVLAAKEKDLEKYKDKIKELFGESKAENVENEIANDIIQKAPLTDENVFCTMYGNHLFYDTISHTWFRSSIDAVKRGLNEFNAQLMRDEEASVDDLCYHYGYELMTDCACNREIWDYDIEKKNLLDATYRFSGHPITQEPCTVITYNRFPKWH